MSDQRIFTWQYSPYLRSWETLGQWGRRGGRRGSLGRRPGSLNIFSFTRKEKGVQAQVRLYMDWRRGELFSVFRQPLYILWMTSYFCKGRVRGRCSWNNPCLQKGSGQRQPASGWRFRNIWVLVNFIFVFKLLYVWRPTWALGLMKGSPGPSFLSGLSFPPRPECNFEAVADLLGTCWKKDQTSVERSGQFNLL